MAAHKGTRNRRALDKAIEKLGRQRFAAGLASADPRERAQTRFLYRIFCAGQQYLGADETEAGADVSHEMVFLGASVAALVADFVQYYQGAAEDRGLAAAEYALEVAAWKLAAGLADDRSHDTDVLIDRDTGEIKPVSKQAGRA